MLLILASSSPFRKKILSKLGLEFSAQAPNIDESQKPNEPPEQLVWRLAEQKALEVEKTQQGLIIASDQIMLLDGEILGKPKTHKNALKQLQKSSGKRVDFLTSLALLNTKTAKMQIIIEPFSVIFKTLNLAQIENYLQTDKPYNCAGGFKSEGLGVALLKGFEGNDPNALIGLPLIQLIKMLENEGINVL
ncbi:MAG: septum formation inhibitor Maf [Candidatus Thioglobus sp.]|nr:septum formation inhibitor Maf [Candidatus Thioglobus sp.]